MANNSKFTNTFASIKELRATVNDLRNTCTLFAYDLYCSGLTKNQTDINKQSNTVKLTSNKMKNSVFSDFIGYSLFTISFFIFFGGTLLICNYIDKTNKNHIIETTETIEVNIVNPGNKQIKVNLPGQAEFK